MKIGLDERRRTGDDTLSSSNEDCSRRQLAKRRMDLGWISEQTVHNGINTEAKGGALLFNAVSTYSSRLG